MSDTKGTIKVVQANVSSGRILQRLTEEGAYYPKKIATEASEEVVKVLEEAIENDFFSLTSVMLLPEPARAHALACIHGVMAYKDWTEFNLKVHIERISKDKDFKNLGPDGFGIKTGRTLERYYEIRQDSKGRQKRKPIDHIVDIYTPLKTGEKVSVRSSYAVLALYKYCKLVHSNIGRPGNPSAGIQGDHIREVGGSLNIAGTDYTYTVSE